MDLHNLKTSWNKINYSPKNDMELKRMTAVKNHPILRIIKIKLSITYLLIPMLVCIRSIT